MEEIAGVVQIIYHEGISKHITDRIVDVPVLMQSQVSFIQTVQKTWKVPQVQFLDCVVVVPVVFHAEVSHSPKKSWPSGEFGKIPHASSSSAGRLRQVAANRARAGEKFLMAHFPASLSMSRLAGSSGTQ